jgi:hypothetical protein
MSAIGYFVLKVLDTQVNDARREMKRREIHDMAVPAIQFWRKSITKREMNSLENRGVEIERYDKIADHETLKDLVLLRNAEQNDKFGQFEDDDNGSQDTDA